MLKLNIAGIGKEKGKTFHAEADESVFLGMKINDVVQGKDISKNLQGYEFIITGASDKSGFPALVEVEGVGRKRLLLKYGKGMRQKKPRGLRLRKTIRGNTIAADIAQINLKVRKEGSKPLAEIFGKIEKQEKADAKEEAEEKPEAKEEKPEKKA